LKETFEEARKRIKAYNLSNQKDLSIYSLVISIPVCKALHYLMQQ